MTTMVKSAASGIDSHIGRRTQKRFDWNAFPVNDGFPELSRAQVRFVGAGGSPKVDDPLTLKPEHFTLSFIHKPVGHYASSHSHEVEESFFVLGGVLTVAWGWDDEVIEAQLGRKDLCLNERWRPHGFRNDGVEPVLMSITVGSGRPLPPTYSLHPRDGDPELAARFGAAPGKTYPLSTTSDDPKHRTMARHVVRYSQQPVKSQPGFAKKVYIGEGGAPAGTYRMDLVHLAEGQGIQLYQRDVEDVYLVVEGVVTVGWDDGGRIVERQIGPQDMIFNPAGQPHYFRNDGWEAAQFIMLTGKPDPEDVAFRAA